APELPLYNEPLTVHRIGPLDVAALEWSLREILLRHEAWRTTVDLVDGEPFQVVREAPPIALRPVDLRWLPEAEREPEALRLATEEARRPFDLARGPLAGLRPIRLEARQMASGAVEGPPGLLGGQATRLRLPHLGRAHH